jgi:ElaB/YqjD/DUF883 family membrane-anchored ribosome-binding protein
MSKELSANDGDIQHNKEILVADLKRIVGDADELLKQMASSTSDELVTVRRKIEAKLSEARSRIDEARIAATRTVCSAADATNQYISENPWKVVGVASLVGLIAALLLYRRSGR